MGATAQTGPASSLSTTQACEACGTSQHAAIALIPLHTLGHPARHLVLCGPCLARRQTGAWSLADETGQRLHEALQDARPRPEGRYVYMMEGSQHVHLLRLRTRWVDEHATKHED